MKQKVIIMGIIGTIFLIVMMVMIIGDSDSLDINKTSEYYLKEKKLSDKSISIKDVRNKVNSDLNEFKNKKITIKCKNISITDNNEIYNIEISRDDSEVDNDIKIDLDNWLAILKKNFGNDIDSREIKNGGMHYSTKKNTNSAEYTSQFYKDVQNGIYDNDNIRHLSYVEGSKYGTIDPYSSMICIETAKSDDYGLNYGDVLNIAMNMKQNYNITKQYVNEADETEYKMLDGSTCTIKNAADYALSYYTNFELSKMNGYTLNVNDVEIIPFNDRNVFMLWIRKSVDNIPLETNYCMRDGDGTEADASYDTSPCTVIGKDNIDMFQSIGLYYKKIDRIGKPIDEIIPLDEALNILEKNLARKTKIIINSIELSYRCRLYDVNNPNVIYGYPVWKFESHNETDDKKLMFYVDAYSGDIETSTVLKY